MFFENSCKKLRSKELVPFANFEILIFCKKLIMDYFALFFARKYINQTESTNCSYTVNENVGSKLSISFDREIST